ncbi:amidohydrolase family protein [Propionibacteriaceae bacterium Y2011]|uniref:amidohydrolase family protein n=1 Tax=Microlunatus sp. Y2014 TaxID=3418488 RepID=UPI003B4B98A5
MNPADGGTGRLADRVLAAMNAGRPLPLPDVVDAHAHLGPYSLFHIPHPDHDTMVAVMDRVGIAAATISANRGIQLEATRGNAMVLAAAAAHPGRLLPVGVVNPWQSPERTASAIAEGPYVGLKVHPQLAQYPVDGPRYAAAFEVAAATGRPLLTHCWEGSDYHSPERVAAAAQAHPQATIILGHGGGSPTGVDQAIAVARQHPNLLLEICGSKMTSAVLRTMVTELGADRVLFGSDFPFIDLRISLGRVVLADLDDDDLVAVLGGNARRVFGSGDATGPRA